MGTLTWLHLSDLHFAEHEDPYNRNVVLKPLLLKLGELKSSGWAPEVVFFTGDVANKGGGYDPHLGRFLEYEAASRFFEDLLISLDLDKQRLFLVPGNHDVDRARIDYERPLIISDREESAKIFGNQAFRNPLTERFHGYAEFLKRSVGRDFQPGGKPYSVYQLDSEDGVRAGVICLNSAWLSKGDNDQGNLVVGERPIREALEEISQWDDFFPDVIFALIHHPLDWAVEWEQDQVIGILENGVDILLRGHLHSNRAQVTVSNYGQMVSIAAGAAYQTRKWPNRVLLGKLNTDTREIIIMPLRFQDEGPGFWVTESVLAPKPVKSIWRLSEHSERLTALLHESQAYINEDAVRLALGGEVANIERIRVELSEGWDQIKASQIEQWEQLRGKFQANVPKLAYFGMVDIPLAVHLGYLVSDWYFVDLHFYDRLNGRWAWMDKMPMDWQSKVTITGVPTELSEEVGSAAIRVSVSAEISKQDVFEIEPRPLADIHILVPNPSITTIVDVEQIRILGHKYNEILNQISMLRPNLREIHLFYAGPPAGAFHLGQKTPKHMAPPVHVYQYSRKTAPKYSLGITLD